MRQNRQETSLRSASDDSKPKFSGIHEAVIEAAPPREQGTQPFAPHGANVPWKTPPTPTTQHCDPVSTPTPTSVLPDTEVGDDHGQLVECTVYTPEEDSQAHKDYERCMSLLDEVCNTVAHYQFKGGWSEHKFLDIGHECLQIWNSQCKPKTRDIREAHERTVRQFVRRATRLR